VKQDYAYPSFFLIQLDQENEFVFITYVPETIPVSRKMIFACTESTLKTLLGRFQFKEMIFASTKVT
jgi:hypothetical protein